MNSILPALPGSFIDRQLVYLGDMMGDGMHREPGGKWIEKEYCKILKAKGLLPKRQRPDSQAIDALMLQRVRDVACTCGGILRQTRSGAFIAKCQSCGNRYSLLQRKKLGRQAGRCNAPPSDVCSSPTAPGR